MSDSAVIGLYGLAVMGQNLALNIASKGFPISVCNRSPEKVDVTVERAEKEGDLPLTGYKDVGEFVASIRAPRTIIILVKAGAPVDATIDVLKPHLEPGDLIIDGGNEWYPNTVRRSKALADTGIHYMGMGVSGGEEGARHGPSLMPGGPKQAYDMVSPILSSIAAQTEDDGACVTWIGESGSGNYVKMVHNGIEYGDMQLLAEAYDLLKRIGGLSNAELADVFAAYNTSELESFLVEITADIFRTPNPHGEGQLIDYVLDKTGMKGTGKWTVQEAAERSVPAATIAAALDARYLSGLKAERQAASRVLPGPDLSAIPQPDRAQLVEDVKQALYCAKVCSYAQGMALIRAAAQELEWTVNLGECARIWKGGCIIRAKLLDRIKAAYERSPDLANLLVDPDFAQSIADRQTAWRRVVALAVGSGVPVPAMSGSLAYYDAYRTARLPASLTQAQRDYFGAHTFERTDRDGPHHVEWAALAEAARDAAGAKK